MLKQLKSMMTESVMEEAPPRDRLILEHLPQVKYIAQRIYSRVPESVDLEDLMGAGIVGLLEAAEKYVAGRGVKFKTYAQARIRGAILDSLRALDWAPRKLRKQSRELEAAIRRLRQRDFRAATDQEIADELEIELPEFYDLLRNLKSLSVGSFGKVPTPNQHDHESEEVSYYPFAPSSSPYRVYQRKELESKLAAAIQNLPKRESEVLSLYYGEELTMKEIGDVMNVTESRICQMHARAIARLRASLLEAGSE